MRLSSASRNLLRLAVGITLAFIYIPLFIILLYAMNPAQTLAWPPESLTLEWFPKAIQDQAARDALLNSLKVGVVATALALVLGPWPLWQCRGTGSSGASRSPSSS